MNINWKLRLQNKAVLTALIATAVTFAYQVMGIIGITAPISEDIVVQLLGLLVNIACAIGVVVDPTTKGVADSETAQKYTELK